MLYLSGDGGRVKIIVLESANLDELRKGRPAKTPDGSVLIAWTPDPAWLMDRIAASRGDAQAIAEAIDEAARRTEVPLRPYHAPREADFTKERTDG
jgi:hypothetical protein